MLLLREKYLLNLANYPTFNLLVWNKFECNNSEPAEKRNEEERLQLATNFTWQPFCNVPWMDSVITPPGLIY